MLYVPPAPFTTPSVESNVITPFKIPHAHNTPRNGENTPVIIPTNVLNIPCFSFGESSSSALSDFNDLLSKCPTDTSESNTSET